jgi:hypothetical protein
LVKAIGKMKKVTINRFHLKFAFQFGCLLVREFFSGNAKAAYGFMWGHHSKTYHKETLLRKYLKILMFPKS